MCEEILFNQNDDMTKTIIRPATVCGYSKRLRLDLVVNILTKVAYFENKIKIFGGSQLRPNIHIDDMVNHVNDMFYQVNQQVLLLNILIFVHIY